MLFPPSTRHELVKELEVYDEPLGICVAHGRTNEILSDEFAQDICSNKITVIVLWRETDIDDDEG